VENEEGKERWDARKKSYSRVEVNQSPIDERDFWDHGMGGGSLFLPCQSVLLGSWLLAGAQAHVSVKSTVLLACGQLISTVINIATVSTKDG
jgi:hypothetical protein